MEHSFARSPGTVLASQLAKRIISGEEREMFLANILSSDRTHSRSNCMVKVVDRLFHYVFEGFEQSNEPLLCIFVQCKSVLSHIKSTTTKIMLAQ